MQKNAALPGVSTCCITLFECLQHIHFALCTLRVTNLALLEYDTKLLSPSYFEHGWD